MMALPKVTPCQPFSKNHPLLCGKGAGLADTESGPGMEMNEETWAFRSGQLLHFSGKDNTYFLVFPGVPFECCRQHKAPSGSTEEHRVFEPGCWCS